MLVDAALKRCDQLGISYDDFYEAMQTEHRVRPGIPTEELLDRTLLRLASQAN